MSNSINCKKHGELTSEKLTPGGLCKLCRKEIMRNNYINNKEKIKIRNKRYQDSRSDFKLLKIKSYYKNREKRKESETIRKMKFNRKSTQELKDGYIKKLIVKGSDYLRFEDIPSDLVYVKRAVVEMKRILKGGNYGNKSETKFKK